MFKKYRWNFVSVVLLVSLIGFIIFDIFFYFNIKNYLFNRTFKEMRTKTNLALKLIENRKLQALHSDLAELYNVTYQLRSIVNSRVTIIFESTDCLSSAVIAEINVVSIKK